MSKIGIIKSKLLAPWSMLRIIRFLLGVAIVVQGIASKDYTLLIFGGLFSLMPILNMGCGCDSSVCSMNSSPNKVDVQ